MLAGPFPADPWAASTAQSTRKSRAFRGRPGTTNVKADRIPISDEGIR